MVRESKSLNIISTEGILIRLFLEFVVEFSTCGEMNGCFGTSALYTSEDNVIQFYTDFPDQTIMAQSGNAAASEGDVTSLGTGQELNFDNDKLKGKVSDNC